MRARLLAGFLVFAVLIGAAIEIPLGFALQSRDQSSALASVEQGAASLALGISAALDVGHGASQIATRYATTIGGAVLVTEGRSVLVTAGRNARTALADPRLAAIERAASRGTMTGINPATQSDDALLYAATPLVTGVRRRGVAPGTHPVLLVASSSGPLDARIRRDWLELVALGLAAVVVAAGAGSLLARSLTRPLRRIETAVAALGDGDLSVRAPTDGVPSELADLAETVNALARQITELLASQRAFVADASHQLRSPLTALRLRLENLEGRPGSAAGFDVALRAMSAEVGRLSRDLDGLLALARAEGLRPGRAPVDVAVVLGERGASWAALAEEQQVALRVVAPRAPAGVVALACPGHLEQMLDNLLANALEVAPRGSTVELSGSVVDDHVEVHVRDEGPGMDEADRRRAFQRFWRGESSGPGGSGLGLAIVEQLARVSGGSVVLDEAPGGGLVAVVRLERC